MCCRHGEAIQMKQPFIFANTDGEPHNTITPIARKVEDVYELDLTLVQ